MNFSDKEEQLAKVYTQAHFGEYFTHFFFKETIPWLHRKWLRINKSELVLNVGHVLLPLPKLSQCFPVTLHMPVFYMSANVLIK